MMLSAKPPVAAMGLGAHARLPSRRPARASVAAHAFFPDPHHLGLVEHLQNLHLVSLADISLPDVQAAAPAAAEAVKSSGGGGPIDGLAHIFESMLTGIDSGLEKVGIPYSYGFAIVVLTLFVKVATYPLSKKQVESTMSMQALQPRVKELQAKFAGDQERLQLETARLYKEANVNPLAGCLPTLATIPVFIGLYRALTLAAEDGLLKEGFFFIPSLAGPTTIDAQMSNQGMAWLFPFTDGAPPLGWEDTARYLVLPVLLVLSQYASMQLSQPKTDDPSMKQTQAILRFLPIMIGWFSLNVPSGLCIYWLTNNVLTTAQQLYLKSVTQPAAPAVAGAGGGGGGRGQIIDMEADGASTARRSRKAETFRAQQASEDAARIAANARGKKRGAKFAERKAKGSRKAGPPAAAKKAAGAAAGAVAAATAEASQPAAEAVKAVVEAPDAAVPAAAQQGEAKASGDAKKEAAGKEA